MSNTKKQKGILFLSKEKIDCYVPTLPDVVSLPFPPHIVRSMDVVDKNALVNYIQSFIQTNKIPQSIFSIVIHESLLFEKLLTPLPPPITPAAVVPSQAGGQVSSQPSPTVAAVTANPIVIKEKKVPHQQLEDEEDKKIQLFIDSVPFEEVIQKTYKLTQGRTIIVTNKNLVVQIKEAFEAGGFVIENVYPASLFGKEAHGETGLTKADAIVLLPKLETVKSSNMLVEEKFVEQAGPVALGMPQKDSEKKRLYAMIGIFILLIGILVFFFIRMNEQNKPVPQAVVLPPEPAVVVAVPSPTDIPVASTSAEVKQSFIITISFSQNRASQSALVQSNLKSKGYSNLTVKTGNIQNTTPLIIYTADVPQDIKDEITTTMISLDGTTTVQENTETGATVVVSY